MFNCSFFRCWSRSQAPRKSDALKDLQSELQKNVQPVSETYVVSDGCGAASTDNDSEVNPFTQLEIESTDNVTPETSDRHSVDQLMLTAPTLNDTVGSLKYPKPVRSSKFQRRSKNIAKTAARYSSFKPMIGSLSRNRDTTVISDWGDCYEDTGDFRISNYDAANLTRVYGSAWSEGPQSVGTSYLGASYPKREISLEVKPSSPVKKMPVVKGMVVAMVVTKKGQRFRLLNLNVTLQEVVNSFLKVEAGASLPVSFTLSTDTRPKLLPPDKMALTLRENLEGYLDELKQGISFFTGPVNGKLSYKMSVCDLEYMEKLFQIASNRQSTRMLRSTDL